MGRKTKANRRVHHRARAATLHDGRVTRRPDAGPRPAWAWGVMDSTGVHQLGGTIEEAAPEQERPGATNSGPFSDSSDCDSEDAGEHQGTD